MQLQIFCKLVVFIFCKLSLSSLQNIIHLAHYHTLFFVVLVLLIKKVNYILNAFRFCGTFFLVVNQYFED